MGELREQVPGSTPPSPPPQSSVDATPLPPRDDPPPPPPPPQFDPSRMIGIIRRKSLIKELAAVYHAECLAYCQELLELQRKREEFDVEPSKRLPLIRTASSRLNKNPYIDIKTPENSRKEITRPAKRLKKSR